MRPIDSMNEVVAVLRTDHATQMCHTGVGPPVLGNSWCGGRWIPRMQNASIADASRPNTATWGSRPDW